MAKWYNAKCPNCSETIELNSYQEIGDQVICRFCGAELEIKSMHPPKFSVLKSDSSVDAEDYFDTSEEDDEDLFE